MHSISFGSAKMLVGKERWIESDKNSTLLGAAVLLVRYSTGGGGGGCSASFIGGIMCRKVDVLLGPVFGAPNIPALLGS